MPDDIAEIRAEHVTGPPHLLDAAVPYWRAFQTLHRARQRTAGGFGPPLPQPIPVSEALAYLRACWPSDDPDDREDALDLLQRLDSTYLSIAYERIARETPDVAPNGPSDRSTRP
ncbi:phage tail assembly chaperone [Gemmatirosa kalamazoonensis]|uniref:phage tail assembly chaperone n=1 Tax=Gemmatirosa kalamazoonensis TaxID=861299 RepID=UPI003CCCD889